MNGLNLTFLKFTLCCISILFFNHAGHGFNLIHKDRTRVHSNNQVVTRNSETLLDSGW